MTVDEIFEIGEAAHKAVMKSPGGGFRKADLARTVAIVRALRDEIENIGFQEEVPLDPALDLLDQILGDAGEKVGAHGSPELDEDARKLEAIVKAEYSGGAKTAIARKALGDAS